MNVPIPTHIAASPRLAAALAALDADPAFRARVEADVADPDMAGMLAARAANRRAQLERMRPSRYSPATFDTLHAWQNPEGLVSRFLTGPALTLLLAGPSGRGKTWAAWAVANTALDTHGLYVAGWSVPFLVDALGDPDVHERHDETRAEGRARVMRRALSADLLLLDDLGREDNGPRMSWWHTRLYEIIDTRLNERRRTIVTFNAASRDTALSWLDDRYGVTTASRLQDDAWLCWVDGKPMRAPAPRMAGGGDQ